jgi:UDP-N-acetylglucosamine 4-epimerase
MTYFNVFGQKQDPIGVYAAAIPKFIDKMRKGEEVVINGDGEQTRDFTFVDNAVQANLRALSTDNSEAFGQVYNVACGEFFTLNQVVSEIKKNLSSMGELHPESKIIHGPDRPGDIRNSLADITLTSKDLKYADVVQFEEGMSIYLKKLLHP